MALKTMIENLNRARKAYDEQLADLGKKAAAAIAEFMAPKIPPGYALTWTQYTPYFNDGEPCVFGVNDPYLVPVDADGDIGEEEDGFSLSEAAERYGVPDKEKSYQTVDYGAVHGYLRDGKYPQKTVTYTVRGFPAIDGWSAKRIEELGDAWDELPEDMLEKAFGDHVRVVIKHDGTFSNDDYEHD